MLAQKTRFLTITALLMALVILLGLTPIGFINLGIIYITFLCIPVLVGTLSLGLKCGLILGFCMGSVSLYTGLRAPSALVAPILSEGLGYVIVMCYVPRLLVPLTAFAMEKALKNKMKNKSLFVSAAVGSLTNTVFYLGLLLLFYRMLGIENATLLTTLGTIVLSAGLPEAAAAALITTPVVLALKKAKLIAQ